jgi:CzcA family heavy metal efflux pump
MVPNESKEGRRGLGTVAVRYTIPIVFVCLVFCVAGALSAFSVPSSVYPQTDFPRVVILVDNGVMPANEMMATITRPIEEAMKDISGATTIRSATGQGSAEVNVFFTWSTDMVRAEQYVLGRLAQIRSTLPATATISVSRLNFSAFPIIGVSLTSASRPITSLWEIARYTIKPRFLRIPDVARVDLVGGRAPEFHVIVDPVRLLANKLGLTDVTGALERNNLIAPSGMHEENHTLYLAVVDGRARSAEEIGQVVVSMGDGAPVRIQDVARVAPGEEPVFTRVTADGVDAVLINVRSQPDGSTLDIARGIEGEIRALSRELPADMKLTFFYDQSLIVRQSVESVWEAIVIGLGLSVVVIFLFLHSWRTTLIATLVIPVALLTTIVVMKLAGLTFNLMTLGGLAAAVGLVIDDAIVVVEAIHTKLAHGIGRLDAVADAIDEILRPVVGSTLTPVVVFLPLAFLDGVTGVFFRALAFTMVAALLTSLALAVMVTPSLVHAVAPSAGSHRPDGDAAKSKTLLGRAVHLYGQLVRVALNRWWVTLLACVAILLIGIAVYGRLKTEFLPAMDEGGFVIDYRMRPGASLSESNRMLLQAESIVRAVPEVESYSRRAGARLALAITPPNIGDILVKLRPDRRRPTADIVADLRHRLTNAFPEVNWEFAGILNDLIGDLMSAPQPIEVRLYSTDLTYLKERAPEIETVLKQVAGVVDTFDGLDYAGDSLRLHVRSIDAQRLGFTGDEIGSAVRTAMLGATVSALLQGDRIIPIRVKIDPAQIDTVAALRELPMRTPAGAVIQLSQLVDVAEESGQLVLRRDDLRQDVAVTARLEGRDLGGAMREIQQRLDAQLKLPAGSVEYAGLFEQQRASFRNLTLLMAMAIVLVFTVLLVEFRSVREPVAIVCGALLALVGTLFALWLTDTSLNVVSFLGAIIGFGVVAKNGILMLDLVGQLVADGATVTEALVRSGQRRLRPVLMTSLAAAFGMLPLAYGIGTSTGMLQPLAIAVIGALVISVLFSLVVTPTVYMVMARRSGRVAEQS